MSFIDHFSIGVADLTRSGPFYDALLATIGAARRFEKPDFICYGTASAEFFVVNEPDDKTRPSLQATGFTCASPLPIRRQSGAFTRSASPTAGETTAGRDIDHNMRPTITEPS